MKIDFYIYIYNRSTIFGLDNNPKYKYQKTLRFFLKSNMEKGSVSPLHKITSQYVSDMKRYFQIQYNQPHDTNLCLNRYKLGIVDMVHSV